MELQKIKDSLAYFELKTAALTDDDFRHVADGLLSIIESLFCRNSELTLRSQKQKNEINILKGEQGQPTIKAGKSSPFSSEADRKEAKDIANPPTVAFRLTGMKLKNLKDDRIPADILAELSAIKNKTFSTREEFLEEIATQIRASEVELYKDALLEVSKYKPRVRKKKNDFINIDRTVPLAVDPSILPPDAKQISNETNIVQDLVIKSDNVEFVKERYYSESLKKTFTAQVPTGWEGAFGPGIKTEILTMKHVSNMSEPKIQQTLQSFGAFISPTYISNRLTFPAHMQPFIDERADIFRAALEVSPYHQIDDTGCRVNGTNQYCQILCNHLYTVFFTTPRKDRLTILDLLREGKPRRYIFNEDAFSFLEAFKVNHKTIENIRAKTRDHEYDEDQLQALLAELFSNPTKGKNIKKRIAEAAAIAHYHQDNTGDMIRILIADDAPQFKLLTLHLGLCWIHIGRHFKKLNPLVGIHKETLEKFQKKFWGFYTELKSFKENPNKFDKEALNERFDVLFSIKTGYKELDQRIAKTRSKKKEMMLVLEYPEIPLHNNAPENGARVQKRREDVSLQTKTADGTIAKDSVMSTVETCRKLDVNPRELIRDRILKEGKIPLLGDIIRARALK